VIFAGSLLVALAISAGTPQKSGMSTGGKNEMERGRYLVEEVAKCLECHTPRKSDDVNG
jgi:hypothetical protein